MNPKLLIHQIARLGQSNATGIKNDRRIWMSKERGCRYSLKNFCIDGVFYFPRFVRRGDIEWDSSLCIALWRISGGERRGNESFVHSERGGGERERQVVQQSIYPLAFTFAMVPASDRFDRSSSKIVTSCCWRWLFQSVASDRNLLPTSFATALWRYPARASRGYLVEKLDFEGSRVNRRLE